MGQVLIIPMLALVPWSVEEESVTGCCAVTFYNLLIIIELCLARRAGQSIGSSDPLRNLAAVALIRLTKDGNLLRGFAAEYFVVTAPVGLREAYLHGLPKLVKILGRECVRSTECQRTVKQRLLNLD